MVQKLLFQDCVGWSDAQWQSYLQLRGDYPVLKDAKAFKKAILERLDASVAQGLSAHATRWACVYLRTWGESGLRDGQFSKILRPLQYDQVAIEKVAKFISKLQSLELGLSQGGHDLLESMLNFVRCARSVKMDETRFCTFFRDHPEAFASQVIAMEERFLLEWSPEIVPSLAIRGGDLNKEEIASVVSYFVVRLAELGFLSMRSFRATWIDRQATAAVFVALHSIYRFYCLESEVFRGSARFSHSGNQGWIANRPLQNLAMAREFGYYQTETLMYSRNRVWAKNLAGYPSLVDWILEHYSAMASLPGASFFQIAPGAEALRIAIPEPILAKIGSDLLGYPEFFREELFDLMNVGYESHVTPKELSSLALAKDFSVMSLIRCNRILRFLAILRMQKLVELSNQSRVSYENSIISVAGENILAEVLRQCGVPDQESSSYLAVLRWNAVRSPTFLDLQYSPIINVEAADVFLTATFSFSNLVRNTMMLTHARMYADGSQDPLVQTLHSAFQGLGVRVATGIKYVFEGTEGDIDLIVQWDRHVFLFEAKNTLLPCNTGEMRTLYDYLEKASSQLDKHLNLFKNPQFVDVIKQKSGIDISQCDQIVACIVLNVRLASGVSYNAYPIRHGWEIANFLTDGKIRLELLGQGCVLDQWQGQTLSPALLAEFLSENAGIYDAIWRSSVVAEETIHGRNWQVNTENYTFDAVALTRNLRQIFPVVPEPDPTSA